MLAFRIITTVLVALSMITGSFKDITFMMELDESGVGQNIFSVCALIIWSLLWRAFVIVSVWVI